MLERRTLLTACAIPTGLAIGAAFWMLANAMSAGPSELPELSTRLDKVNASVPASDGQAADAALARSLLAHPLFQLAMDGAAGDPTLRLEGVSLTLTRSAALIAIAGKPAQWLQLGETREGVTLRRVAPLAVTVESFSGEHSLALGGERPAPSGPTASAAGIGASGLASGPP